MNCNGQCLKPSEDKVWLCDGQCQNFTIPCDGRCVNSYYVPCEDKCQKKTQQCNGECLDDFYSAVNCDGTCSINQAKWICDSECIPKETSCKGECDEGTLDYLTCVRIKSKPDLRSFQKMTLKTEFRSFRRLNINFSFNFKFL